MRRGALSLFAVAVALCLPANAESQPGTPPPPSAPSFAYQARLAAKAPLLAIAQAGTRLVAVGDYGVIVLSDDQGRTWRQATSVATRNTLTAVSFVDARLGWAVGHGGTVLHTRDGGDNWQLIHSAGADVALLSVRFEDAEQGIAVGAFGFAMATGDGGRSWRKLDVGEGDDRDRHLNAVFGASGGPLYIAAEVGTLFRSTDGGRTWTTARLPYNGSMWGGLALRDGSVIVYGMRGHVLRSADQGKTWTDVPTGTDQSFAGGVELAGGGIVLVGLGGAVARSRDGGRHFDSSIRPDRQTYAAVAAAPAGHLVVVGLAGATTWPGTSN